MQQLARERGLHKRPLPARDTAGRDPPRDAEADVLTPEIVEAVVTRTIELARLEPDEHAERRRRLTSDAQRLQEEIARITEATSPRAARSRPWWTR